MVSLHCFSVCLFREVFVINFFKIYLPLKFGGFLVTTHSGYCKKNKGFPSLGLYFDYNIYFLDKNKRSCIDNEIIILLCPQIKTLFKILDTN